MSLEVPPRVVQPVQNQIDLSVVIPVYRAEGCIHELYRRLVKTLESTFNSFEIVLVEDCGNDRSWDLIRDFALKDSRVRGFKMSRNFGQQAAITAGLSQARGNWTVVMDCDLQDPPENIPDLHAKALQGFDLVFAKRKEKKHSAYRKLMARLYFLILNAFTGSKIDGEYGSFSIISREVREAYLDVGDKDRHYLFILYWLGFESSFIEYDHASRFAGESSYTFSKLVSHALSGLVFQTTNLLRWIIYLGFSISAFGGLLALVFVYRVATNHALPGWTSLIVVELILGGFIVVSVGVVGLYIGKIFEQARNRPLFVFSKKVVDGLEG